MDNVVGFVLAILFALVMRILHVGRLVGDYVNTVMNEQTRHTLRIVGLRRRARRAQPWGGAESRRAREASPSASCSP